MDRTQDVMLGSSVKQSSTMESIAASGLHQIGNGTKEHPYILCINVNHPEHNREFNIERVSNIEHNSYTRNGFYIRLPVAPVDFDQWEASIPTHYPTLQQRVVQVKGPSRSFWIRSTEWYHKKISCTAMQHVHAATKLEIDANDFCQVSYWLLVFPENITLDNQIFSNDSIIVEPGYNAMSTEEAETEIGKKLYSMAVYWKIAEVGGHRVQSGKLKPSEKKLFD
jgi:hypothetical protein